MKFTATRLAVVALLAVVVGVAIALIVYVTLVAGVIFLVLAVTGTFIAYRQKQRLAAAANPAANRIEHT